MVKKNVVVVIPTFLRKADQSAPQKLQFDHPTTLEDTTLTRCLQSLEKVETSVPFKIAILWSPDSKDTIQESEQRLKEIIAPFISKLNIGCIGLPDLKIITSIIRKYQIIPDFLDFDHYPTIRNLQLFVSAVLEADCVIGVDDDEIVKPDFIDKAVEFVDTVQNGQKIAGVGGLYLNSDDENDWRIDLQNHDSHTDILYKKSELMNRQHEYLYAQEGRLVKTPEVFGGCMVFGEEIYHNVPFDPFITRGEDIDYLINSLAMGYNWFLDKDLHVIHLPPHKIYGDGQNRSYSVLVQDTIRFLYQKEKVELLSLLSSEISLNDLGIYPGEVLKINLKEKVKEYLESIEIPSNLKGIFPKPEQLVNMGVNRLRFIGKLFYLMKNWHFITTTIAKNKYLQDYINSKFE